MSDVFEQRVPRTQPEVGAKDLSKDRASAPACSTNNRAADKHALLLRVLVIFGALCLIKLGIIASFQKHLYEIHWRTVAEAHDWTNEVAFFLFTVIVGLNLWVFGMRCMEQGRKCVRFANGYILILGMLFILLTFHEGDKNYLFPVLNGILSLKNVMWYLACDFFFRPPYLIVWIIAYAGLYFGFARKGMEHRMILVTAIFAALYLAVCFHDFAQFKTALVTVDAVGLGCLAVGWRGGKNGVSWVFPVCLAAVVGLGFILLHGLEIGMQLARLDRQFFFLTATCLTVLVGVSALAVRQGFFRFWGWLMPFAAAALLLLVNTHYPLAPNYGKLLSECILFPRYFSGELLIALLLLIGALGCQKLGKNLARLGVDLVGFALIAWALADWRLSQLMGARLDWSAMSLAMGETPRMMWRMSKPYLRMLLLGFSTFAGCYYLILAGFKGQKSSSGEINRGAFGFGVFACLLCALLGKWLLDGDKAQGQSAVILASSSPIWQRIDSRVMDRETFLKKAEQLGMGQLVHESKSSGDLTPRDLNVVIILQESTYNKHLSLFGGTAETQPLLSRYKDRMELFTNFFANFAGSIQARFATFSGIYPVRDYQDFTLRRVPVKSIFECLHENDYRSSLFYSSYFDYTGFRDYLRGRGIDELYDAETMPGERKLAGVSWGLREEETLSQIKSKLKRYAAERTKFCLTYIPAAPHNPFDGTPERFRVHRKEKVGDLTPAYLNELLYMDWVIASIVDELRDSGLLENTLVVITSDHGEMLGENDGPIGHGWAVNRDLCNIPLIIMDPSRQGFRINHHVGSQVDLLPTILGRLGIPIPEGQLYQGTLLDSLTGEENRTIYMDSFRQFGIVCRDRLFLGERGSSNGKKVVLLSGLSESELDAEKGFPAITEYDQFQLNFLRNYSHYCELLQRGAIQRPGRVATEMSKRRTENKTAVRTP